MSKEINSGSGSGTKRKRLSEGSASNASIHSILPEITQSQSGNIKWLGDIELVAITLMETMFHASIYRALADDDENDDTNQAEILRKKLQQLHEIGERAKMTAGFDQNRIDQLISMISSMSNQKLPFKDDDQALNTITNFFSECQGLSYLKLNLNTRLSKVEEFIKKLNARLKELSGSEIQYGSGQKVAGGGSEISIRPSGQKVAGGSEMSIRPQQSNTQMSMTSVRGRRTSGDKNTPTWLSAFEVGIIKFVETIFHSSMYNRSFSNVDMRNAPRNNNSQKEMLRKQMDQLFDILANVNSEDFSKCESIMTNLAFMRNQSLEFNDYDEALQAITEYFSMSQTQQYLSLDFNARIRKLGEFVGKMKSYLLQVLNDNGIPVQGQRQQQTRPKPVDGGQYTGNADPYLAQSQGYQGYQTQNDAAQNYYCHEECVKLCAQVPNDDERCRTNQNTINSRPKWNKYTQNHECYRPDRQCQRPTKPIIVIANRNFLRPPPPPPRSREKRNKKSPRKKCGPEVIKSLGGQDCCPAGTTAVNMNQRQTKQAAGTQTKKTSCCQTDEWLYPRNVCCQTDAYQSESSTGINEISNSQNKRHTSKPKCRERPRNTCCQPVQMACRPTQCIPDCQHLHHHCHHHNHDKVEQPPPKEAPKEVVQEVKKEPAIAPPLPPPPPVSPTPSQVIKIAEVEEIRKASIASDHSEPHEEEEPEIEPEEEVKVPSFSNAEEARTSIHEREKSAEPIPTASVNELKPVPSVVAAPIIETPSKQVLKPVESKTVQEPQRQRRPFTPKMPPVPNFALDKPQKCTPFPPPGPQPLLARRLKYCQLLEEGKDGAKCVLPYPHVCQGMECGQMSKEICVANMPQNFKFAPFYYTPHREPLRRTKHDNCYPIEEAPPLTNPFFNNNTTTNQNGQPQKQQRKKKGKNNGKSNMAGLDPDYSVAGSSSQIPNPNSSKMNFQQRQYNYNNPQASKTNVQGQSTLIPNSTECDQHYRQLKALEEKQEFLKRQYMQQQSFLQNQQKELAKKLEELKRQQIHKDCETGVNPVGSITNVNRSQQVGPFESTASKNNPTGSNASIRGPTKSGGKPSKQMIVQHVQMVMPPTEKSTNPFYIHPQHQQQTNELFRCPEIPEQISYSNQLLSEPQSSIPYLQLPQLQSPTNMFRQQGLNPFEPELSELFRIKSEKCKKKKKILLQAVDLYFNPKTMTLYANTKQPNNNEDESSDSQDEDPKSQ